MLDVLRMKKTGQIVYALSSAGANHTHVLLPFSEKSVRGKRGTILTVRNENLKKDRESLF